MIELARIVLFIALVGGALSVLVPPARAAGEPRGNSPNPYADDVDSDGMPEVIF